MARARCRAEYPLNLLMEKGFEPEKFVKWVFVLGMWFSYSKNIVQKATNEIVKCVVDLPYELGGKYLNVLEELIELTWIDQRPIRPSQRIVREVCVALLTRIKDHADPYALNFIRKIKRITGISPRPSKRLVQQAYRNLITREPWDARCLSMFMEVYRVTKEEPKLSKRTLKQLKKRVPAVAERIEKAVEERRWNEACELIYAVEDICRVQGIKDSNAGKALRKCYKEGKIKLYEALNIKVG